MRYDIMESVCLCTRHLLMSKDRTRTRTPRHLCYVVFTVRPTCTARPFSTHPRICHKQKLMRHSAAFSLTFEAGAVLLSWWFHGRMPHKLSPTCLQVQSHHMLEDAVQWTERRDMITAEAGPHLDDDDANSLGADRMHRCLYSCDAMELCLSKIELSMGVEFTCRTARRRRRLSCRDRAPVCLGWSGRLRVRQRLP